MATLDSYLHRLDAAYWPSRYAATRSSKTPSNNPPRLSNTPKRCIGRGDSRCHVQRVPIRCSAKLSSIEQMYADYDQDPANYKRCRRRRMGLVSAGLDPPVKRKKIEGVDKLVSAKLLKEIREYKKTQRNVKKRFSTPACMLQFRLEELTQKNDRKMSLKKCLEVPDLKYLKGFNINNFDFDSAGNSNGVGARVNDRGREASPSRAKSVSPARKENGVKEKLSLIDKLNRFYDDEHMAKLFGVLSIPADDEKQEESDVQNFHDLKRAKLNEEENQSKAAVNRWRKEADEQWSSLENFLGAPTTASHYWHHLNFCKQRFKTRRKNSLLFRRKNASKRKQFVQEEANAQTSEPVFNLFTNKVAFASVLKFKRRLAAIRAAKAEFDAC